MAGHAPKHVTVADPSGLTAEGLESRSTSAVGPGGFIEVAPQEEVLAAGAVAQTDQAAELAGLQMEVLAMFGSVAILFGVVLAVVWAGARITRRAG